MDLLFAVEDDEDHPEGVERGHKCADQTRNHQVDMTIRHRAGEDFVLTEEACGDERQCGQRRAPTVKQTYTSGIDLRRPPILKMFCSWWQARMTEPDERNSSALKNAWVIRWKIAASHARRPAP